MVSSTPSTGFQEAFDDLLLELVKASDGGGEISLSHDLIERFHNVSAPSSATIPRKLVGLFEGKDNSIGTRLVPHALYTLSSLLMHLPHSHAGEKLIFHLIDTIKPYKDASATAKRLTAIIRSESGESSLVDPEKKVVSEKAVYDRRRYICRNLSVLSLKIVCNKSKMIQSRRLAARVVITVAKIDPATAKSIHQDKNKLYQKLGGLLREESDYVFRFLVADLIRELLNLGLKSEDLSSGVQGNKDVPMISREPYSHSLWMGDVLEILSEIDTHKPVSNSSDRVFKLHALDIGSDRHEDKAGHMLMIFSDTINFLLPGDVDSSLQLVEFRTRNAITAQATASSTEDQYSASGLINVEMPGRDGDRWIKGSRRAIETIQLGLANATDVASLQESFQCFFTTAPRNGDPRHSPQTGDLACASEKQSIMFADMTLYSEDEAGISDAEASSFMTDDTQQIINDQSPRVVAKEQSSSLAEDQEDVDQGTERGPPENTRPRITGEELRNSSNASYLSPDVSSTPQPSSDVEGLSVVSEQDAESPSLHASQNRLRRQEQRVTVAVAIKKTEPARVAISTRKNCKQRIQHDPSSTIPSKSVSRPTGPTTSHDHINKIIQTRPDNLELQDLRSHGTESKASHIKVTTTQPATPVQSSKQLSVLASGMARLAQPQSSTRLKIRKKDPSKELGKESNTSKTDQDIYEFDSEGELTQPLEQAKPNSKNKPERPKTVAPAKQPARALSKPSTQNAKKGLSKPLASSKHRTDDQIKTAAATRGRRTMATRSQAYNEVATDESEDDAVEIDGEVAGETVDHQLQKIVANSKAHITESKQADRPVEVNVDTPAMPTRRAKTDVPSTDGPIFISSTISRRRDPSDSAQHVTTYEHATPEMSKSRGDVPENAGSDEEPIRHPSARASVVEQTAEKVSNQDKTKKGSFAEDSYPQATLTALKENVDPNLTFGAMLEPKTQPQRTMDQGPVTPFGNRKEFIKHVNSRKSASPRKSGKKNYAKAPHTPMHDLAGTIPSLQPRQRKEPSKVRSGTEQIDASTKNSTTLGELDARRMKKAGQHEIEDGAVHTHHSTLGHNNIDPQVFPDTGQPLDREPAEHEAIPQIAFETTNHEALVHDSMEARHDQRAHENRRNPIDEKALMSGPTFKNFGTSMAQTQSFKSTTPAVGNGYQNHPPAAILVVRNDYVEEQSGLEVITANEQGTNTQKTPLQDRSLQKIEIMSRPHLPQNPRLVQSAKLSPRTLAAEYMSIATRPKLVKLNRKSAPSGVANLQMVDGIIHFDKRGAMNSTIDPSKAINKHPTGVVVEQSRLESGSSMEVRKVSVPQSEVFRKSVSSQVSDFDSNVDQESNESSAWTDDEEHVSAYDIAQDGTEKTKPSVAPSTNVKQTLPGAELVQEELLPPPCLESSTHEPSQSEDFFEAEEISTSGESIAEDDSEYIEASLEHETSAKRTNPTGKPLSKSYIEPPQLSDAENPPVTRKHSSKQLTLTTRSSIGLNSNPTIDRSLQRMKAASAQKSFIFDDVAIGNSAHTNPKTVRAPSAFMPLQTVSMSKQAERSLATEEKTSKRKARPEFTMSESLMPPPKRPKVASEDKAALSASRTIKHAERATREEGPVPVTPDVALKRRVVRWTTSVSTVVPDRVIPIGTPLGFSTLIDAETKRTYTRNMTKSVEAESEGQDTSKISTTDLDITLVNDIASLDLPGLDSDQQSETTEDTTSSSEPDLQGTPAPQYSRRQADLSGPSRDQQGVHDAIVSIADLVLARLGTEEDAVDAELAIYQRGGHVALKKFSKLADDRLNHEIKVMTELLQTGQTQFEQTINKTFQAYNEKFSNVEPLLADVDQKKKDLLARIDKIQF